jgi:serine/threonine-protein kinase
VPDRWCGSVATPTPGWSGAIYAAASGPPGTVPDKGWTRVATLSGVPRRHQYDLATKGRTYRYYLVWITGLPPSTEKVEISEIRLFQSTSGAQNR